MEDFDIRDVLLTIAYAMVVGLLLVLFSGCRTTKKTYQYTGEDYTQVTDSQRAESHTEQTQATQTNDTTAIVGLITFADGGGVVTSGGVQLSGVAQIDGSVLTGSQVFHVEHYIHDTTFVAVRDTLTQTRTEVVEMEKEVRPSWWWYLLCFVCGAGVVVALKKIPYTRPLMFWL